MFFFQQSNRRKPLEPGDISAKEIRDGKTKVVLRSSLLRDCLHFTSIFKESLIRKRKYKSFFSASPSRKRIEPVLVSRLCFSFFFFFLRRPLLLPRPSFNYCTDSVLTAPPLCPVAQVPPRPSRTLGTDRMEAARRSPARPWLKREVGECESAARRHSCQEKRDDVVTRFQETLISSSVTQLLACLWLSRRACMLKEAQREEPTVQTKTRDGKFLRLSHPFWST